MNPVPSSSVQPPLIREKLRQEAELAAEVGKKLAKRGFAPPGVDPLKDALVHVFARYCDVLIERLNRVQRNRQSLLQQVAALSVPADSAAGRSASLFQQAEQRSIASDWHYRDWLAKRTSCGSPKPNADLHAAVVSDRAATRTKQQFVAVFDPLARRFHRRAWTATEF